MRAARRVAHVLILLLKARPLGRQLLLFLRLIQHVVRVRYDVVDDGPDVAANFPDVARVAGLLEGESSLSIPAC